MIEINLIPDVKRELLRAQTQRNMVVSLAIVGAIIAAGIVILIALYVYGAQALIMRNANNKIDEQYASLSSVEDLDKMLTIQNQLNAVSSLNKNKRVSSRLYDVLNVTVPRAPHNIKLSSMAIEPAGGEEEVAEEDASADEGQADGPTVVIEGQASGGYASLEVFEKMIAAAVVEYKPVEGFESKGDLNCGSADLECKHMATGGGDRSQAVAVSEMSFGEDQEGAKTLYFKLSFTVAPEVFSNQVTDVRFKIGQDGNVTDSHLGVPRAIFEGRPAPEEGEGNE